MAITDRIEEAPADRTTGRLVHIGLKRWARGGPAEIVPFAEDRWVGDDKSGRAVLRRLPALPVRTFDPSTIAATDFAGASTQTTTFAPGELTFGTHGPVPTTTEGMSALLNEGFPGGAPPEVQLQVFQGLFEWDYLGRDSRAAALGALALVRGLVYEGDTSDPFGRAGVAVSLTVDGTRLRLIVNRTTGQLLAFERAKRGGPVDEYSVYLTAERTSTIG